MKNLAFILIFILLSCRYDNKTNSLKNTQNSGKTETIKSNNKELEEIFLPYCFKVDTMPKSNYYQTKLDAFLSHHSIIKSNLSDVNRLFHKNTEDFVSDKQANFMHYPYEGKAFAISELKINNNITAIFFVYLFDSEMIQPRIEIQTFDHNQKNIDNLIIASTFSSECSGYRDFCISQKKIISINDYYYCEEIEYKNQYKYKINDTGKFIFSN